MTDAPLDLAAVRARHAACDPADWFVTRVEREVAAAMLAFVRARVEGP